MRSQPDRTARWISHLLVGFIVGAMVERKGGMEGFLVAAAITAGAHEMLDAPVANLISGFGA